MSVIRQWLSRLHARRDPDRIVAMQFLAVVVPIAIVLVMQVVADIRRANALAHSSPLREIGREVRSDYRAFVNGVADAVDTGALGGQSIEALKAAATRIQDLQGYDGSQRFAEAQRTVIELAGTLSRGAPLSTLLAARTKIQLGDKLTKALDETLTAEDLAVVSGASASAARQKILVPLAVLASTLLTIFFVVGTQRRMRARLMSDRRIAAENLRIKNALDNGSVGIMVTDADGIIVYANAAAMDPLARAESTIKGGGCETASLFGMPLSKILGRSASFEDVLQARRTQVQLGQRIFRVNSDAVADATGQRVGYVIEWIDRTEETALESQVASIVAAAGRGEFHQRIEESAAGGPAGSKSAFFTQLVTGINRLMQTSEVGLQELAQVLQALAQGDLTQRITRDYGGTFGELRNYSNQTMLRMQAMVGQIKAAADAIESTATDISDGNSDLNVRTEAQAARLQETARSMQELTHAVHDNASHAHQADTLANAASQVAANGGEVVSRVVRTMSGISESSRRIADIVSLVDTIAFQTNLLALNAAIEAARAGEQGRGFSVVAAEVRALAQRSAGAAKEIKHLINDSVQKVSEGTTLVQTAGDTMGEVVAAVDQVTALIKMIAVSSQAQSKDIERIGHAVAQMDGTTQQNAALVREAASAATSLREQASGLVTAVAAFRLDKADSSTGITHVHQRSA